MGIEIERKFLVVGEAWRGLGEASLLRQGSRGSAVRTWNRFVTAWLMQSVVLGVLVTVLMWLAAPLAGAYANNPAVVPVVRIDGRWYLADYVARAEASAAAVPPAPAGAP